MRQLRVRENEKLFINLKKSLEKISVYKIRLKVINKKSLPSSPLPKSYASWQKREERGGGLKVVLFVESRTPLGREQVKWISLLMESRKIYFKANNFCFI